VKVMLGWLYSSDRRTSINRVQNFGENCLKTDGYWRLMSNFNLRRTGFSNADLTELAQQEYSWLL